METPTMKCFSKAALMRNCFSETAAGSLEVTQLLSTFIITMTDL